jgi:DNA repair exonuclease SbcCD ATPase subunit
VSEINASAGQTIYIDEQPEWRPVEQHLLVVTRNQAAEIDRLNNDIKAKNAEIAELENENGRLRRINNNLAADIRNLQTQNATLQDWYREFEALAIRNKNISDHNYASAAQNSNIAEMYRIQSLNWQWYYNQLLEAHNRYMDFLRHVQATNQFLTTENQYLRVELNERDKVIVDFSNRVVEMGNQLEILGNQLAESQRELKDKNEEYERLQREYIKKK